MKNHIYSIGIANLKPIDIAKAVGMTHREFSRLTTRGKWYYFFLVHFGPNYIQIQYLLRDLK